MLTPLYLQLHVSALKGPSSGSTDTFSTQCVSRCKYQIKEQRVVCEVGRTASPQLVKANK
jgi:hypothetical protein